MVPSCKMFSRYECNYFLVVFFKKTKVIFKIILERHRQRKEKVFLCFVFFFFLVSYVGSPFEMTVNIF